jgi:hypothetical protein
MKHGKKNTDNIENLKNSNKNAVLNEKHGLLSSFSLNLFKIFELEIFYANIRV